jgi:hypothetical protein
VFKLAQNKKTALIMADNKPKMPKNQWAQWGEHGVTCIWLIQQTTGINMQLRFTTKCTTLEATLWNVLHLHNAQLTFPFCIQKIRDA